MSDSSDIIIKGGSVELSFDGNVFSKANDDPGMRKAKDWKITQVIISGGGMEYDSPKFPQGSDCTIRIVCKR